ncbi:MAG: phospholipase D family protein [Sedimenticola sp.]|nr:phospholipase D family protein [Sedimenticola sp.]
MPSIKREPIACIVLSVLLLFAPLSASPSQLTKIAEQQALYPAQSGVTLLEQGEQALLTRAILTDQANSSIDVQYFIWSTDNVGTLSSEALLRAAERGVTVRIIVDDFLIDAEPETLLSLAAHPNIFIRIYNPRHSVGISLWERLWGLISDFRGSNQRMHDKSTIFDGTAAITGGRNMADEYFDYDHAYNFRDRDVLLAGPVVKQMSESFQRFWDHPLTVPVEKLLPDEHEALTKEQITHYQAWLHAYAKDKENFAPEVRQALLTMRSQFEAMMATMQWGEVEFISDLPGKNAGVDGMKGGGETTSALLDLIARAQQSILIQSPYLVMPEGGLALIRELIKRGVKVRIVTNSLASTDNPQAFSGYHKQREQLLAAGIQIFEFKPDAAIATTLMQRAIPLPRQLPIFAIHAKSLVIDEQTAYVGTFNLDPRSAHLNTEVGVVIRDRAIARQITESIGQDMKPENSWQSDLQDPDSEASLMKRIQLWFWKLFPLDPIL